MYLSGSYTARQTYKYSPKVSLYLGASTIEAQIGVSIDVAEGIVAALKGEPVMTAVNKAPVSPQVMNVIKPFFEVDKSLICNFIKSR